MLRFATLASVLLLACGAPMAAHDAGRDGERDAAPAPPRDAWFGDTHAGDTGACATAPTGADVAAILGPSCAVAACHSRSSPDPGGGLILDRGTPRSQMVGTASSFGADVFVVVPGDPEHSLLWRKLTDDLVADGTEGAPMPQGDAMRWVPLAPAELETIRCWIVTGAP